jgi:hypothetical protein
MSPGAWAPRAGQGEAGRPGWAGGARRDPLRPGRRARGSAPPPPLTLRPGDPAPWGPCAQARAAHLWPGSAGSSAPGAGGWRSPPSGASSWASIWLLGVAPPAYLRHSIPLVISPFTFPSFFLAVPCSVDLLYFHCGTPLSLSLFLSLSLSLSLSPSLSLSLSPFAVNLRKLG